CTLPLSQDNLSLVFCHYLIPSMFFFSYAFTIFFFNDTATTEFYTLSLHDALPIFVADAAWRPGGGPRVQTFDPGWTLLDGKFLADRKSTRLNSSHVAISYAVFCLKKKTLNQNTLNQILDDELYDA